jgi:hypothetical protein
MRCYRWGVLALLACLVGLSALCGAAETYSWQKSYAKVDPKGELSWTPEPFAFQKGDSVRYIDFAGGNDANPGTSPDKAWKHHPWDPQATGQAKPATGVDTYVFKRGVAYRGNLVARESGKAGHPIRLTSDPSWGEGDAIISGSELVSGWKQGAQGQPIPDPQKVWTATLDFAPRRIWVAAKDGSVTRVPLARTPNWTVTDPEDVMSEWWQWENPGWWVEANRTVTVGGKLMHLGIDARHLTQPDSYYKDAVVWSEWAIVMGTPFPTKVMAYYPQKKAIAFEGRWFGATGQINTGNRYFLEDKPQYLDSPGEFWFDKRGPGGTLYIRLPGDLDPNTVQVEAAKRYDLIEDQTSARSPERMDILPPAQKARVDSTGLSHVVISGLTFRYTNAWWEYWQPPWWNKNVDNACIRLLGSSDDVTVANCKFEDVSKAVRITPLVPAAHDGSITVCDNDIERTDDGAINVEQGAGTLEHVDVLRNKLYMIGMRPFRQSDAHALVVGFPRTMLVAGNMLTRTYGAGLFLFGGKPSGAAGDTPLARYLVFQNRAYQTLLAANDWGGIETWQGGPFYNFDNISGDPNGFWNWSYLNSKNGYNARLGYAFYHDGGHKNYDFNNIIWGLNNEAGSKLCNASGWNEATPTIHNNFFNNTIYRFAVGSNWSPAGGYHSFLGNLWDDISNTVFDHGQLKEDKGTPPAAYPYYLMAYGNNLFHAVTGTFGHFEAGGENYKTAAAFHDALVKRQALDPQFGTTTDTQPLRDPANWDMRPAPGSAAIDGGVKFFVPWGLYAMVGEWNFYHDGNDVTQIPDEHWYMADYYRGREAYASQPTYPLTAVNVTADSYVEGNLEDWIHGALKLNGKDQYATIAETKLQKPVAVAGRGGPTSEQPQTVDVRTSSFILEIYLKTEPGAPKAALFKKMDDGAGYALTVDGAVTFATRSGGKDASVAGKAVVNDGKWHHVLAEADRKAGAMTIYVDGKTDASGGAPAPGSLANKADFYIGGTPQGECLNGTVDFAMVSLGSLADAKTTIGELYAWQSDGPFLRDFAGNPITGAKRDAGALEFQPGD